MGVIVAIIWSLFVTENFSWKMSLHSFDWKVYNCKNVSFSWDNYIIPFLVHWEKCRNVDGDREQCIYLMYSHSCSIIDRHYIKWVLCTNFRVVRVQIKTVWKRMSLYKWPLYDLFWSFFLSYVCLSFTKLRFWPSFWGA